MAGAMAILGSSILALLLAGYLAQQYLPPPKPKVIGVDLGTTYCSVGVFQPGTGKVEVIADKAGRKSLPSVVLFTDQGILVGYEAQELADANPLNTLYDAKRFIGKRFTPEELSTESGRYQFKILYNKGDAVFSVFSNESMYVSPEYIGSLLLLELKKMAEQYLGTAVSKAVISVPAEFDERQRNHTVKAAQLAGLDILRVINEPTAAAMAYGLHKVDVFNVLVVDLGGGTLDVSLLNKQGGMFLTRAMAGNNQLGGQDFNQRLLQFLFKQIYRRYKTLPTQKEDVHHLRQAVEAAKLNLTLYDSVQIRVPLSLPDPRHSSEGGGEDSGGGRTVLFEETVTRDLFEVLNRDLFEKILQPVQDVLSRGHLGRYEVDEIVLVGGSTRIPRIRQVIREFFGKEPNTSVDPDLAVVIGVAIQAGIMGGSWPLQVSALEIPNRHFQKVNFN
ncbi:heat shock 70 kDa protein 13 [Scyliorhinus canicula]|uniref:heat shock 70 kDa protein 13 n=1 Tax=Scyliorhinus canicula TaxID=7830 RepID=UPI0018F47D9A|nr:heat shock 70 kDa protein 13 [Scyliorhinus canicula]